MIDGISETHHFIKQEDPNNADELYSCTCDECGKNFRHIYNLKSHIKKVHQKNFLGHYF